MENMNNEKHLMVTELDCAKECELKMYVGERDILLDIKDIINEYYVATFKEDGSSLKVALSNGQAFKLTVSEILEQLHK